MKIKIDHSRPTVTPRDIKEVSEVLKSSYLACGIKTKNFENRFEKLLKINSCIALNSGTSALHSALFVLGIKPNDVVILPSLVCSSVLDAVLYVGAQPKIVDIDPVDFNLSFKNTQNNLCPNLKVIILPHMFGKPVEMNGFLKLGVPFIENCAQSLGAKYKGKLTGGFGKLSIFSFYATKMITSGYGGMVCSRSKKLIQHIKDLTSIDERSNFKVRFNYKMSDISASLGISQLKRLKSFIVKRREIAAFYDKNLKLKNIILPNNKEKNHIYFRYVIRVKNSANKIIKALNNKGIEAKKPVFKPLHQYLGLDKRNFPNTEEVFNSAVSLPIYPDLTKREAKFIVASLSKLID